MDKVLLIDGHNFLWRANVGFKSPLKVVNPNATTPSDEFIIIFNFFRNLRPVIEQFSPNKCFFVLEGHPKFRYDIFPEYKANRRIVKTGAQQESKDRLYEHKDVIFSLLKHLPITLAKAENYECDDVIATLAENMQDEDVTILSNDSDFIQILEKGYKNVKLYNPYMKDYVSITPYPYLAWKCLRGDDTDNIPGFKGIGDKTAAKLLSDPKKFDEFLDQEERRAHFNINRSLIEFRQVPLEEIQFTEGVVNWDKLKEEFTKMQFNSIVNEKSWTKYVNTFNCLSL